HRGIVETVNFQSVSWYVCGLREVLSMNADHAVFLPDALLINVPEIDAEDAAKLLEILRTHCATEEALAREAGLEFSSHAAKHQQMLKGIAKTLDEVGEGHTDAFSLIRYLEYWFERHIREEDIGFGLRLQGSGAPMAAPQPV